MPLLQPMVYMASVIARPVAVDTAHPWAKAAAIPVAAADVWLFCNTVVTASA